MLRMIPPIVVAVPVLLYYSTIGLLDSYMGLIVIYVVSTLPYSLWMTESFIDEIPVEVEQAAELLGASRARTLWEVVLPLVSKYEGSTEGRLYGWQQALSVGVTLPLIAVGYAIHQHLVRGFSFGMLKR